MAVIDSCQYDLFVSYAHADNYDSLDGAKDITRLHNSLRAVLRQRLGASGRDLSVFFDAGTRANEQLDDLIVAARNSALFLVVGSPAWVGSEFCPRELQAFCESGSSSRNIFVAEYLPLRNGQIYPDAINQHLRFTFHRAISEESETRIPMSATDDTRLYRDRVHSLAEQLVDRLLDLKAGGDRAELAPAAPLAANVGSKSAQVTGTAKVPASPKGKMKRALLAEPTDDLQNEAAQVRAHLEQYDVEIVTAPDSYEGLSEFKAGFEKALGEADLMVQLLGPHVGKRPSSMPDGIARFQYDAAMASGTDVMQWRNPGIQMADLTEEHREFLEGHLVSCSTLAEFKSRLVKALEPDPEPTVASAAMPAGSFIFVDADERDREAADLILNELENTGMLCMGPAPESTEAKARLEDLEQNFTSCDALLLLHGQSPSTWVRSQLVLFTKLRARRKEDLKLMAICKGPPMPKDDIRFRLANAHVVDCGSDWDMSGVRSLMDDMAK